jgi:nicotinamide-nucleotide amidase
MVHAVLFERGDRSHQHRNEAHGQAFGVEINRLIAAGEDLADELSRVTCGEVTPARLKAAVDEYLARQNRSRNPLGHSDSGGRWLPAPGEWQACCDEVRAPSRAFPVGLLNHCRTIAHVSRLLGVDTVVLKTDGAVSEATVRAMASGALQRMGGDVSVAVSGVAGPDGGTPDKPVGTVWFAWARRDGDGIEVTAVVEHFPGDREAVRRRTVERALSGLLAP